MPRVQTSPLLLPACDDGFVADNQSGYCYQALADTHNLDDADNVCHFSFDAELVNFDLNSEVDSFIEILSSGNYDLVIFWAKYFPALTFIKVYYKCRLISYRQPSIICLYPSRGGYFQQLAEKS